MLGAKVLAQLGIAKDGRARPGDRHRSIVPWIKS
jgi:hypothetical protein